MQQWSPRSGLRGLVGIKNEGRSLFIFYNLIDIYNKLSSQDLFKTRYFSLLDVFYTSHDKDCQVRKQESCQNPLKILKCLIFNWLAQNTRLNKKAFANIQQWNDIIWQVLRYLIQRVENDQDRPTAWRRWWNWRDPRNKKHPGVWDNKQGLWTNAGP